MTSKYRLVIVRDNGDPVYLMPGGTGERDITRAIVNAIMAKGVGFFRTEAHVQKDVVEAIDEVIHELKAEVMPI